MSSSSSSSSGAGSQAGSLTGTAHMENYPDWMGTHVVPAYQKLHPGSFIKQTTNSSSSISGTVQQLKTGNFDFGLADVSATQQAVDIGLVQPPDWSKIPNIKYVGQSFRTAYPHGIPTDYGKIGIGYRPDLVGEKITSWHDVWRLAPKFSGKIVFIDLDRDGMGSALKYLGYSGNSTVQSQLTACKNALIKIKPHLQAFLGVNYGQGLQDGSTVIAMDYDYDVALNQQKQPKIEWVFPAEGMVAYLEGWIAMKSSKVLPLVESFMNFALEPKQYGDFGPEPAPFGPPELAPRPPVEILQFEPADQTVARSIAAGRFEFVHRYATQRFLLTEPAIEVDTWEPDVFTICEDEPLSAVVRCARRYGLARPGGWRTRLESVSEMRADATTFRVWTSLRAFENEECLFSRTWTFDIPRDGG